MRPQIDKQQILLKDFVRHPKNPGSLTRRQPRECRFVQMCRCMSVHNYLSCLCQRQRRVRLRLSLLEAYLGCVVNHCLAIIRWIVMGTSDVLQFAIIRQCSLNFRWMFALIIIQISFNVRSNTAVLNYSYVFVQISFTFRLISFKVRSNVDEFSEVCVFRDS